MFEGNDVEIFRWGFFFKYKIDTATKSLLQKRLAIASEVEKLKPHILHAFKCFIEKEITLKIFTRIVKKL